MKRLLVFMLVACGGTKPAPVVEKPVVVPDDPTCPTTTTFKLADGKLRCRELPLTIDFPAGSELERQDNDNLTFIRANLDRGVLGLFLEPRIAARPEARAVTIDATGDDAKGAHTRLEAFVRGIASDATLADAVPPPQAGATASTGISFTTPDGGMGVVYGYLVNGWFVAVAAGGRLAETPARPDKPMGQAFLASLKLRATTPKWAARDVFDGVKLELPLAAWEVPQVSESVVKATKLYAAVGERAWIGARELQPSAKCELFTGVTDADVPAIVKKMFGSEELTVTGKLAPLGTQALYAEIEVPGKTMVLYLVCVDSRIVLVTVTGTRPLPELKTAIDRVMSPLPRR